MWIALCVVPVLWVAALFVVLVVKGRAGDTSSSVSGQTASGTPEPAAPWDGFDWTRSVWKDEAEPGGIAA